MKIPWSRCYECLAERMTIFLPRGYITIYTIKSELKDKTQNYKKLIIENTLLIHYTGATKPDQ